MSWRARKEGKRPIGRCQQTWKEGIQKILKERRIEWKGIRAKAGDHERWKSFFVNPLHLPVEEVRLSKVEFGLQKRRVMTFPIAE